MPFINQVQKFTLYIFFFSINFEMLILFSSVEMSISRFTGILYFIALIPDLKSFIRTDRIGNILLLVAGFFGLLTLMSLINMNEVSKEFFNISLFQNIMLFLFLVNHGRKDYMIVEKGMLVFALGSIVIAIMYFMGIGVEFVGGRLTMFKENQNALGLKMCIGIIILIMSMVQDKLQIGKIRFLFLAPIPLMIDFVAVTGSRLAFISLVLCIVTGVILIKTKNSSGKLFAISIGVVFLILLGILLMQSEVLRDRLLESVQTGESSGRGEIWNNLVPLINENPIFGVGITGFIQFATYIYGERYSPHNVILEVLCYTGVIGLFIYLSFLYQIFKRSFQSYNENGILLPLLLILPAMGLILGGQILDVKFGWIIFAYIMCSSAIKIDVNPIKMSKNENFMRN